MPEVQCRDCGFLALAKRYEGTLVEATNDYRHSGTPTPSGQNIEDVLSRPICFMRKLDMRAEFEAVLKKPVSEEESRGIKNPNPDQVLPIIERSRRCDDGFTPWQLGFSPKEHREMLDRKWERKWRLIELGLLALMGGGFTALGAWIASL